MCGWIMEYNAGKGVVERAENRLYWALKSTPGYLYFFL